MGVRKADQLCITGHRHIPWRSKILFQRLGSYLPILNNRTPSRFNPHANTFPLHFQDGRGRVEKIDTTFCPVYMLTGEYDYSCTTDASKATADKIPGAVFEPMKNLGHFPLTENPKLVSPYLLRALDFIEQRRE